ncbi:MAG: SGNH/GDSL hydrolase family protein [Acholeplasmataceae bacterium]
MKRLVCIGDSITDWNRDKSSFDDLGNGYVPIISKALKDVKVFNRGISGNKTTDLLLRWQEDLIDLKPDVVTILIGINEIWHHYAFGDIVLPEAFKNNYMKLIEWTKKECPDTEIILMTPFVFDVGVYEPIWQKDLEIEQDMVKEIARHFDLKCLDMQSILDSYLSQYQKLDILSDGVHPTQLGFSIIADHLLEVLKQL